MQTPQRVVKAYIMHRQWREQTILACLEEGVSTIPGIVAKIYGELDADLKAAASLSVLAHLEHLIRRGLAVASGLAAVDAPAGRNAAAGPPSGGCRASTPSRPPLLRLLLFELALHSGLRRGRLCLFEPGLFALLQCRLDLGEKLPNALSVGAQIVPTIARCRANIDEGLGVVAPHADEHVVGEAHEQGPIGGFDAASAILARRLGQDDGPAKPLHRFMHHIEDFARGPLQLHRADIGIGFLLFLGRSQVRLLDAVCIDRPQGGELVKLHGLPRRRLDVVEARQQEELGEIPERQRQPDEGNGDAA